MNNIYTDKITNGIIGAVITDEFHKFAAKHADEFEAHAADYAVQMLTEIRAILDERIPLEKMHEKIMKIVLFHDTPPFPRRANTSYQTFK